MAGPILRAREFLPALQPGAMPQRSQAPLEAALLIGRGYFKKMVLADRIAVAVDPFFLHLGTPATAGVWSLPYLYLYAFQIYFDFSGYTDIARGLALLFGFRWPDNFTLPYLATSVREYWRRWHITLSRFLRDYVYVPLGGNRHGTGRTAVNLMLTMLLGGLWHGGTWSFVLWGALHGGYLVAHRFWSRTAPARALAALPGAAGALWSAVCVALTFHAVCIGFALFRPTSLAASAACLRQCVDVRAVLFAGGSADASLWILLVGYGALWLAARQVIGRVVAMPAADAPSVDGAFAVGAAAQPFLRGAAWGTAGALLALAVLLAPSGAPPPFIYFQF
jgi:D-alanyl-lipoteichoic acid acyltransferase DltB (MBOAT superfamily)